MGTAFGYYLFDPAFFWFLIVMVALAFLIFGLTFGMMLGRNTAPGGDPNAVPRIPTGRLR